MKEQPLPLTQFPTPVACHLALAKSPLVCKATPIRPSCMANTIKWATPPMLACNMDTAKVNNLESKVDLATIKSWVRVDTVHPMDMTGDMTIKAAIPT